MKNITSVFYENDKYKNTLYIEVPSDEANNKTKSVRLKTLI